MLSKQPIAGGPVGIIPGQARAYHVSCTSVLHLAAPAVDLIVLTKVDRIRFVTNMCRLQLDFSVLLKTLLQVEDFDVLA